MNTLNFFVTLDYPTGDPHDNKCGPAATIECRGADADQPEEFDRQRSKLLQALSGLDSDVIGLNELENSPGAEPLQSIISGLPGYDYVDTGTIGTDAIKVGLIYRPGVVTPVGPYQVLSTAVDPRFIDTKSRPSLAQTFEENATGARFTVVVNHLKSKGSDCNDVGDPDLGDGQGNCSQTRKAAAEALVDWLATDPTGSGDPDFLVVGDLNSYAMEETITAIRNGADGTVGGGDDYTNLIAEFQGAHAYSYTFDGQAGYLDHALASSSLAGQVTGAADWHINADEPDVLDYDTSFKPAEQEALYEPNAYRTSDHDPVVIGLDLDEAPSALSLAASPSPATYGDHVTLTATVSGGETTPTGEVTIVDGSTVLGTGTIGTDGRATLTTSSLNSGTHSLSATYAGDETYRGSSGTFSLVVNKVATRLTMPPLLTTLFHPVATLTTVGGSPVPGQTVRFTGNGRTLCTAITDAHGVAGCPRTVIIALGKGFKAGYDGDADHLPSSATGRLF
jgi:endonuclease/exonuclease/phosphatase family metal-dependent hydrolase